MFALLERRNYLLGDDDVRVRLISRRAFVFGDDESEDCLLGECDVISRAVRGVGDKRRVSGV